MSADDGHGPRAGCTYFKCGIPADADNCPFTRDGGSDPDVLPETNNDDCKHEWRQLVDVEPAGFYCIHCLSIKKIVIT